MECLFKTSYWIDKYYWQRRFYWRWSRSCLIYIPSTRWKNRTRHCVRSVRGEWCAWCTRFFFFYRDASLSFYLCLCVSHDTERKTKLKGGAAATGTVHGGGLCETESILALNLSGCPPLELHETVWFPGANQLFTPDKRWTDVLIGIVWNYVNHSSNGNKHCVNGNDAYRAR